jgi:hypothetical protein
MAILTLLVAIRNSSAELTLHYSSTSLQLPHPVFSHTAQSA